MYRAPLLSNQYMKKTLAIFNGIRFSFSLANHSIDYATQKGASLHGLFIKAKKEEKEGYLFPSDIDPAQNLTDREDAESDDLRLIKDEQKLLKDLAKEKNIQLQMDVLTDPSLEELLRFTRDAEIVFINDPQEENQILAVTSFELEDLVNRSQSPVEVIHEDQ